MRKQAQEKSLRKLRAKQAANKKAASGKAGSKKTGAAAGAIAKNLTPQVPATEMAEAITESDTSKQSIKISNGLVDPNFVETIPEENEEPLSEAQLRKIKTGLTRKDLGDYNQLLLQKRDELHGDVASLETDVRGPSGGNLSNLPLHMTDVGSDNYEQEFTLGLVESERRLLREIEEALLRIQDGYYGVCLETGVPINRARLDAKPWAKYCIEVAREKERLGQV